MRLLPGVLVFQTYRRFLRKRHNCAGTVPECDFGCPSGGDFVTDQEASCLFEKMPRGKVSTNQVREV